MLPANQLRLLDRLPGDALVLDVGGWASPLPRADWVIDLMPYDTRGLYGYERDEMAASERFSADSWVTRDICDHRPWPFEDDQFDFAVCSHTLEDVRDPIWVCHELSRVARAGYVEVPSRLAEQTWGIEGPWVGWSHHRWLIDIVDDRLEFVHKSHVVHAMMDEHFPPSFAGELTPEQRVQWLWWEGEVSCEERVFLSGAETHEHLRAVVQRHGPPPSWRRRARKLGRVALARARLG